LWPAGLGREHEAKVKIASGLVFILVVPWTQGEDVEPQHGKVIRCDELPRSTTTWPFSSWPLALGV